MNVAVNNIGNLIILPSVWYNALNFISFTQGNRAYFFGGVYDDEEDEETLLGSFFNDLYCLDLEKLTFNRSKYFLFSETRLSSLFFFLRKKESNKSIRLFKLFYCNWQFFAYC